MAKESKAGGAVAAATRTHRTRRHLQRFHDRSNPTTESSSNAVVSYSSGDLSMTSDAETGLQCCFPVAKIFGRRKRTQSKAVRFSASCCCAPPPGTAPRRKLSRKHTRKSSGRSSFYSAVSRVEDLGTGFSFSDTDRTPTVVGQSSSKAVDAIPTSATDTSPHLDGGSTAPCECGHIAHVRFDPTMPIARDPSVEAGSYDELMTHAKALLGRWITVMERSESLDPQMVHVGISKMKRIVINRLQIQFEAVLIDNDRTLKCWIETPTGNKYTHASLVGEELQDSDGDLGDWSSKTSMIDYSTHLYCGGKPVRAMQLERHNPKFGVAYETRAILPDPEFKTIFLYTIRIVPPNNGKEILVNRVYRRP